MILNQKGEIKLSAKDELNTLKRKEEDLEKRLREISSTLEKLHIKKSPILKKVETLSNRTSSLAQTLLEKAQEELEKVNQEVVRAETSKAEVSKELNEIKQKIFKINNDFSIYIKIQSSMMASTFIEYVRNHLKEIGSEIKKTYNILEITKFYNSREYYGCYIPTGNIGIYDESIKSFIVISKNFYFKHKLYTLYIDDDFGELSCHRNDWYKNYRDNFILCLCETLQKNYCFDEDLKLTIEDSYFTLELV